MQNVMVCHILYGISVVRGEEGREGGSEELDSRFKHCKHKQNDKEQENGYHCRKAIIVLLRGRGVVLNVDRLWVEATQRNLTHTDEVGCFLMPGKSRLRGKG